MNLTINGRFLTQRITGVQRYAHELVQAFDAIASGNTGITFTVLSPRLSVAPPVWRNVELRQVGHLQGHAWEQFELPWHARGRLLFCPGNTAPVMSLLSRTPPVVTIHDLSYAYFPDAYRLAFRLWYSFIVPLALRRASAVITVSESERRAILARYPAAARLHAIANGGLPAAVPAETTADAPRGSDCILYVGSLSRRKNFPRMFEAVCRLIRNRGFRFVVVGDTSKSLAASMPDIPHDVASKVTFVGAVDDPAVLASYYRQATCLLFASLYESSGLPPIEAMACGCPVVASNIPALRERCGDAAIYCDPQDVQSIAAATERVMDDVALRRRLQELGRQRAATFTWEHCARQTLDVIRQSADAEHRPSESAST